jgi:hypothetical protein
MVAAPWQEVIDQLKNALAVQVLDSWRMITGAFDPTGVNMY